MGRVIFSLAIMVNIIASVICIIGCVFQPNPNVVVLVLTGILTLLAVVTISCLAARWSVLAYENGHCTCNHVCHKGCYCPLGGVTGSCNNCRHLKSMHPKPHGACVSHKTVVTDNRLETYTELVDVETGNMVPQTSSTWSVPVSQTTLKTVTVPTSTAWMQWRGVILQNS